MHQKDFKVSYKKDDSPLTIADQRANDIIEKFLSETNIPILSEEGKQIDFNERKKWNLLWIVDPLDGTKEFVKRNGEFTVKLFELSTEAGPTTKITHRIILSGEDKKGLLHKIINTLDDNSAVIVRMNTEKISFSEKIQYICRFAISIRDENAPQCLSQIVKVAGEMKLTFRYETS